MAPIRVLIVDDHPVVRAGIRSLLAEYPGILVVGESPGGLEVLQLCGDQQPDVVLMDIKLADRDGLALTRSLLRAHPQVHVIVLTSYDNEDYLLEALRSGAAGYLLKGSSAEILADTIQAVQAGQRRISPDLMTAALGALGRLSTQRLPADLGLTGEQHRLLRYLAAGLSTTEIAAQTFVSERTVKRQVQQLLATLGVASRSQAVAEAYRKGLLN